MAWEKGLDLSILDKVLPEYQKISEAPAEGLSRRIERSKRYKAIDTRTGDIYLTENPSIRSFTYDDKGRCYVKRTLPELHMTNDEAKMCATATTASFIKAQKKGLKF